jgi:hypothetical protein
MQGVMAPIMFELVLDPEPEIAFLSTNAPVRDLAVVIDLLVMTPAKTLGEHSILTRFSVCIRRLTEFLFFFSQFYPSHFPDILTRSIMIFVFLITAITQIHTRSGIALLIFQHMLVDGIAILEGLTAQIASLFHFNTHYFIFKAVNKSPPEGAFGR